MTVIPAAEPSRVTVRTRRTRVDVALPPDVALAELLPDLLALTGEEVSAEAHLNWGLSRLGHPPLDANRTLSALGVRHGETLYLRPHADAEPPPVYDDVVEVVATSAGAWGPAWTAATSRRAGLLLGAAVVELGILPLVTMGGSRTTASVIAVVAAVALLVGGAMASRAFGDGEAGAVLAIAALGYAFVAGLGLIQPTGPALARVPLTGAWVGLLVASALGLAAVARWTSAFTFGIVAGLTGTVATASALLSGAPAASVAAGTGVVAVALLVASPSLAIRLTGLRPPAVAWDTARTDREVQPPDAPGIEERTKRSLDLLTGLILATSSAVVAVSAVLAVAGRRFDIALAALLGGALVLRARTYRASVQVATLLGAGIASLSVLIIVESALSPGDGRWRWLFLSALAAGVVTLASGLAGARGDRSPRWGRLLDITDGIVLVALIPVGLAAMNLYATVRGLGH